MLISVEPCRSHYRIVEDGVVIKEVLGPRAVIDFLHAHLFRCSMAERPNAALLHAASLRRNGGRLLLAGTKGAGKTTLALALTRIGYEIESDEHVFVDNSGVVARPRACRVKESALPMLADMAKVIAAAPSYTEDFYGTIFNVDPRTLGSSWRIAQGQADVVIALHDNHGGYSSIRPLAPMALVQLLMPEMVLREAGHGPSVAAVATLAGRAKAFDLSLGELAGALCCLEGAVETCL